uniref:UspA domain-containing protein n=1 Tax=Oryza brachyantha TaxID=4533 RepID=J3LN17_ORYBR
MDGATEEETAAAGRRILVAVDEGDESVHALKWCLASFAKRGGGAVPPDTIILLYVRPPPPTYSVLDASVQRLLASNHSEFRSPIDRISGDLVLALQEVGDGEADHEMKVEVKVAVGDARNVICQMVDKLGADVLVMGSHGYGLFKRSLERSRFQSQKLALLGSVSDYCVRNANCPVLIVKS